MIDPLIPIEYTQVLVPIDCTPVSQHTVDAARRLIGPMLGAHITLMATIAPVPESLDPASAAKLRDARRHHAEQALASAGAVLTNWGIYYHQVVCEGADLADSLAKATASGKYDLVAVSSVFLTEPDSDENLARRVARTVSAPVLILPREASMVQ